MTLLGLMVWTSRWYRQSGRLTGDEVANQVAELGMSSVLREPAAPPATGALPPS